MTQTPAQPPVAAVVTPPKSNGLGVAGFITSIIGVLTCGALAPIGLLLSLLALFKAPRGFAIAGVVVGLVGSLILGAFGVGIFAAWMGFKSAGNAMLVEAAKQQIESVHQHTGSLPSDTGGDAAIHALGQLPMGQYPRYQRVSDVEYTLTLPGADGRFGTSDDVVSRFQIQAGAEENP